jgi:hypothetical protein
MEKETLKVAQVLDDVTGEVKQDEVSELDTVVIDTTELELIKNVVDRFEKMKTHRETSCVWNQPTMAFVNDTKDSQDETQLAWERKGYTRDWSHRWDRDNDLAMMKSGQNRYKTTLPDVSVPITFSAVTAFVNQYQDSNTSVMIDPSPGESVVSAKLGKSYIEFLEDDHISNLKKNKLARETAICGNAFTYNSYVVKKRKVRKLITGEEVISQIDVSQFQTIDPITGSVDNSALEKEAERIQNKIKTDPESILTREEVITDYQGVMIQHVPLKEFFVDPQAKNLNGVTNDARDCVWRRYLPIQQVINDFIYSEDPFVLKKNLNKDLFTSIDTETEDFTTPQTDDLTDVVELLQYYNKYEDQFIIIANRKVIIRKGPIPYNHKKLPFSHWTFIPLADSFYGVGFATLLDTTQQNMEFFQSLQSYLTEFLNNKPATAKGETALASLSDLLESNDPIKAGQIIEVGEGDEITPLNFGETTFDLDKVKAQLTENAIQTTFINPTLSTNPNPNLAVRSAQAGQESGLLAIRSIIQNIESSGYIDVVEQALSMAKQFEPENYTEIKDEKEQKFKKQYRKMTLEGYGFKDGEVNEESMVDTGHKTAVELTPEILSDFDKLKVRVKIETTQVSSRSLQAQEANDSILLAMQIRGNPVLKDDPIINALFKKYLENKNADDKVLAMFAEEDNEDAEMYAQLQNNEMEQGLDVTGIPGMTENHKLIHKQLLTEKLTELHDLARQQPAAPDPMMTLAAQAGDPNAQAMMQQAQSAMTQQADLVDLIQRLRQHLALDEQMPVDGTKAILSLTDQALQPPMPPQGQMQMQQQAPQLPQDQPMNPMSGI